ncbi:MAG: cell envelope integrity protein TolA [Pseudomonadales bacterium]|nr:cell envelope integrity protein TolA [Pseudomonadales bacterium]
MSQNVTYFIAIVLATLVHVGVVGLLLVNWDEQPLSTEQLDKTYYIQAAVVSENPFTAKERREQVKKQREQSRKKAEIAASRERARIKTEQEREQERARRTERKRKAVVEKQHELDRLKALQQQEPTPAVEHIALQMDSTENMDQEGQLAITDDEKARAYVAQIQRDIVQNWSRPPSARNGMQAVLRVFLVPTGEVVDVIVEESSGNESFDRSAILAVNKADRFIVPRESRQFERNFREFTVLFRPEDLRL